MARHGIFLVLGGVIAFGRGAWAGEAEVVPVLAPGPVQVPQAASARDAAYEAIQGFLDRGELPPRRIVRVAAMLDAFDYHYPQPVGDAPVLPSVWLFPSPWNPHTFVLHIGLQPSTRPMPAAITAVDLAFDPDLVIACRRIGEGTAEPIASLASGHPVTVLFELTPRTPAGITSEPIGTLSVRYVARDPQISGKPVIESWPISMSNWVGTVESAPEGVRFATAVAAFGQILKGERTMRDFGFDDVRLLLPQGSSSADPVRAGFTGMVERAANAAALPPSDRPIIPVDVGR